MKTAVKIILLSLPVFLLAVCSLHAQESEANAPPPPPAVLSSETSPPPEDENQEFMQSEDYFTKVIEKVRKTDPNEAARLEKLRGEDIRSFHQEIRKIMRQQIPEIENFKSGRLHRGPDMESGNDGPMGKEKIREHIQARENELTAWLEKNEPEKAKELAALKVSDPPAYTRRMMFEMRNYHQIIDAEQTNPALAEALKKDLALKKKRNELLDKLRSTTDEKQKTELTKQLKEVIGQRFDLIVQKKQLKYEELKKRLEDLQKTVDKSQAELENLKSEKDKQVEKHLEELLSQSEKMNWD